ncbi:MAG: glycosyltransferase family 4 protein [Actinobacteria bacterium]|nr:glycosyltransferase family 4 protein [Actinomycetota bacterium]
MRIAYFSPLNPIKSGISDYSEELLEYLSGYGVIDLFVDDYKPSASWLYDSFKIESYRTIYKNNGTNDYDINIYHMGNNEKHSYIYSTLLEYPGLAVLHEPMLHHFVFSQTVGNNDVRGYLRELDYCYKSERSRIVKTTLEDHDENSWYDYPMVDRLVDSSLGIIVHSEFARRKVLEVNDRAKVRVIPHHYAPPPPAHMRSPELIREILGFAGGDFIVGFHGYMTASKRIDVLLKVMARIKDDGYNIKLMLVGKILPGCEALRWIDELDLDDNVLVTGFVDTRTFREYLCVPDVFVALRHPSAGETSGSVIKMMGAGKPVVLSDQYAFSEFPDDCCIKIGPQGDEEEQLMRELVSLIENPGRIRTLGENARSHILAQHDIQNTARRYVEFAADVLNGNGM